MSAAWKTSQVQVPGEYQDFFFKINVRTKTANLSAWHFAKLAIERTCELHSTLLTDKCNHCTITIAIDAIRNQFRQKIIGKPCGKMRSSSARRHNCDNKTSVRNGDRRGRKGREEKNIFYTHRLPAEANFGVLDARQRVGRVQTLESGAPLGFGSDHFADSIGSVGSVGSLIENA